MKLEELFFLPKDTRNEVLSSKQYWTYKTPCLTLSLNRQNGKRSADELQSNKRISTNLFDYPSETTDEIQETDNSFAKTKAH